MSDSKLTETQKAALESHLEALLPCDNVQLLGHFSGAVRTLELADTTEPYTKALLDSLWNRIIEIMDASSLGKTKDLPNHMK